MIILDVEQGSPEWFAARLGIPTASEFSSIVTATGEWSKSAEKYAYRLAGERVTGAAESTYNSFDMERGKELEQEARLYYEFVTGNTVQQVGLVYRDDTRMVSCSPDGLVGDDGGLEIKCPKVTTHIDYLFRGNLPAEYHRQVHGSLYVTGRSWWDFMSYYPGLQPLIVRVFHDDVFMRKFGEMIYKFNVLVEETVERIKIR